MTASPFQPDPGRLPGAEEVHIEETVDGVRYLLPGRLLGGGHVFGASLTVAGIAVALAGAWWGIAILANGPAGRIALALTMITPVLVFLLGGLLWSMGMFIAVGRSELLLLGSKLHRIERASFLRWTSRSPIGDMVRLRIEPGLAQDQSVNEIFSTGSSDSSAARSPARLMGEYETGRTVMLLYGYPQPWLEAVAHDLAHRLDLHPAHQARPIGTEDHTEVIVTEPADRARRQSPDPVVKPADSAIEVARSRDGLTITIPPLGLRERKGAFSLGAAWNGVMAFFTGGMFAFMHAPWQINVGIALFWLISLGVMLVAVTLGRRSAIIDIVDETLLITQRSLFGVKQRSWHRDEIRSIECGSSGLEVAEQPVMQLQITPASGGTTSHFTGRDEEELRWLARILREALRVPADGASGETTAVSSRT